ncbi:hypothetical protein BCE02nite_62090 [Brevibacillus centrosporus]|uniref:DUF6148 family protein n=1 Tax=Brevibacillus centrosporus TaxID=54910 RepID=UPI000F0A280E|nr:DUF6148 family protein [Brevibacillus centrosporus]RNB72115.1 hypothetical protein EDM55_06895 [Brevibacillus centrosporus]GED35068.1 hypothetical protein BCE02nite_62090 [Brevibacillus centrosporus]
MPRMTLEEARAMYKLWSDAERALASSQSYTFAGKSLTRSDMSTVLERKKYYGRICDELETGRRRSKVRSITPFDL